MHTSTLTGVRAPRLGRLLTSLLAVAWVHAAPLFSIPARAQTTYTYQSNPQYYSVPAGVTQLLVVATGGSGGAATGALNSSTPGGRGAQVRATIAVTPGEQLVIITGGQGAVSSATTLGNASGGYNGGGNGSSAQVSTLVANGGGGGGATDLRRTAATTNDYLAGRNALLVAGGGGGAANSGAVGSGGNAGGAGGTPNGQAGSGSGGGTGATQGQAGGGALNNMGGSGRTGGGGGGGGGYYGGQGGSDASGGGGGSSWASNSATGVSYSTATSDGDGSLTITPLVPLPVQLVSFTAQAVATGARLTWQTASELNSAYFEVERSANGLAFAVLARVAAASHSLTLRTYTYQDAEPPAGSTQLYYRLRQVDHDGTAAYSVVRTVAVASTGPDIYPNPARQAATLRGAAAGAVVQVYDALGTLVLTTHADAAGSATLVLPASLPAGLYLARSGSIPALRFLVE